MPPSLFLQPKMDSMYRRAENSASSGFLPAWLSDAWCAKRRPMGPCPDPRNPCARSVGATTAATGAPNPQHRTTGRACSAPAFGWTPMAPSFGRRHRGTPYHARRNLLGGTSSFPRMVRFRAAPVGTSPDSGVGLLRKVGRGTDAGIVHLDASEREPWQGRSVTLGLGRRRLSR